MDVGQRKIYFILGVIRCQTNVISQSQKVKDVKNNFMIKWELDIVSSNSRESIRLD
jgi:hypothetical protein